MLALRCKAVSVLVRTTAFAMKCTPGMLEVFTVVWLLTKPGCLRAEYGQTSEFDVEFKASVGFSGTRTVEHLIETPQERRRVLDALLDRLPPLTYDPTTVDIDIFPLPDLNIQVILTHKLALSAYIQLCNAVDVESGNFAELYDKRLEIARRTTAITQAFLEKKIRVRDTGIVGAVRPSPTFLPLTHLTPETTLFAQFFWFPVARVYAQHIRRLQSQNLDTPELVEAQAELKRLVQFASTFYLSVPVTRKSVNISIRARLVNELTDEWGIRAAVE